MRHFTTVKARGAEYDTCEYRESVTAAHSVGFLYCMYIHILDVLTEECTSTETGGEGEECTRNRRRVQSEMQDELCKED